MDVTPAFECEPIALLRGVPLFAGLAPEQLADLACHMRQAVFARDETILRKDEPGDCLYVIHGGRVRIELPSNDGPPVVLRVLGAGEFFGELALLDGKPRSATAVAMETTRTLTLRRDDFQEFLRISPHAAIHILAQLADRLRQTSETLCESVFYDTASRLAKRLLVLAETEGRPGLRGVTLARETSHDELAEMVGSTAERVRQELDSLEQDQIIAIRGDRITVLSPPLLRERVQRKPTVGPGSVTIPTWLLE
jgi:CRP/FNR family transcriptional regulator, cyclic AMP receptor protein